MPEYLSPGVYVEEIEIGPKSIEGVSTSTAALLGETERGPLNPTLITGLEQYRRVYGSYSWTREDGSVSSSLMRHALEGFFGNGGKRCFVARIVGAGATPAAAAWIGLVDPEASARVARAQEELDAIEQKLDAARKLPEETDEQKAAKRREIASLERDQTRARNALDQAQNAIKAAKPGDRKAAASFTFSALGPGNWGNSVFLVVEPATLTPKNARLFKLTVEYWKAPEAPQPWLQEIYDNLSPDPGDANYIEKRINSFSDLITVEAGRQNGALKEEKDRTPVVWREKDDGKFADRKHSWGYLAGGADGGQIDLVAYNGAGAVGQRTGLAALEEVDEISIICAPNEHDFQDGQANPLTDALVTHCENLKDRFAIIQAPPGTSDVANHYPPQDSKYAAYYYPWIKVIDGGTGVARAIPPGGHVAGIYARTDVERGVFKAPANEVVRGAVGVEFNLTVGEQDILNPRGVNCIRAFLGRGIRLWGARTVSSDPLWKYVNVRRLFLYLEESIQQGTQWVVFEPNDQRLWARVKQSVADFLTTEWRNGALMGNTADEAFFVKCDETTMTQNDLDNGRLIVVIGVAPVKPAEFVIFRIAQWTRGSEAAT